MDSEGPISRRRRGRGRYERLRRRLLTVIFLLLGISAVLPIAAHFFAADIYRFYMIQSLDSANEDRRNRAFSYFLQHAQNDPGLVEAAVRNLRHADEAQFKRLQQLLERAGFWNRRHVPEEPWRRWLDHLAESDEPRQRLFAAIRYAELPGEADDEALQDIGWRLIADPEPAVRFEMLLTAARMSRAAAQPLQWEAMVGEATGDPDPYLARDAIILFALIDSAETGRSLSWRDAPWPVAKATLFATATTRPDQPRPIIEALADPQSPPMLRAAAAWAAGLTGHEDARDALVEIIHAARQPAADPEAAEENGSGEASSGDEEDEGAEQDGAAANEGRSSPDAGELHLLWAAVRYVPVDLDDAEDPAAEALTDLLLRLVEDDLSKPANLWPALAAIYRLAPRLHEKARADPDGDWAKLLSEPLPRLAMWEGLAPGGSEVEIPRRMEDYPALAGAIAAETLNPHYLRPALRSPIAPYRDLAVLVAAERLGDEAVLELSERLLASYNDQEKLSGAMLAGVSGQRPKLTVDGRERDALEWRAETARTEQQWPLRQVYEMALWMQGRKPDWQRRFGSLLDNERVAPSTLYLGLLTVDRNEALRELLEPRRGRGSGEAYIDEVMSTPVFSRGAIDARASLDQEDERITLLQLLVRYRWMGVLERHLPEPAPLVSLWADRWVQQFELDVLRYWLWLEGITAPPDGEGAF